MNESTVESTESNAGPIRTPWLEAAAFVVIAAVAVVLRFEGIDFGFPEHVRPDEQYFVQATRRFDSLGTLDPNWYYYPSFYMYLNLVVWRGYTLVQFARGTYDPARGIDGLRARAPDIEFLLGRCVTALFGIATVLLVYALARRFYGRKAAVAAAFLLAVNGLHTLNSHFYKSDVATTFFTLAALACMCRYVQERRLGWNLGAAVLTGLAAATNYYGGFVMVPLLVSQFLAPCCGASATSPARFRAGGAPLRWETYAMPLIAGAVFVATSPYCFIRWSQFLPVFHRMLFADRQSLYDTLVRAIDFEDFGFQRSPLLYSLAFCYRHSTGLILGVVSAVGLAGLVLRRRAIGSLLVLFFAVHFIMTASGKAVFMRYYLSLVPVLTLGAGVLLSWAVQKIAPGRRARQNAILALALVVCGFESAWVSLQQNRLLGREDTRVEASRWIAKNLPRGAAIGTPVDWWWDNRGGTTYRRAAAEPLSRTPPGWRADCYGYGKPALPAGGYVAVAPGDVRRRGLRYLVVDDSLLRLYSPRQRPGWPSWLEANAKLLHAVSPYDVPAQELRARYDQLDAFYVPVARFRGIRRPGPRICIYAVRSPD